MKRIVCLLIIVGSTLLTLPANAAAPRLRANGAEPVSWVDDGCWIHVHHKTKREDAPKPRPYDELHVQCTERTNVGPMGAIIKYRYPGPWGVVPRTFGALIEEDGHGAQGDLPYISAWQDPEHPRIGYVHVPGISPERPHGIYVHVMFVVWNGRLDDAVREVSFPPYG